MPAPPAATAPPAASATARGEQHQGVVWGQCLCPCLRAECCLVGCAPCTLPFHHYPCLPTHPLPSPPPPPGPGSDRSEKAGAPGEYRPEFRGGFGRGAAPQ